MESVSIYTQKIKYRRTSKQVKTLDDIREQLTSKQLDEAQAIEDRVNQHLRRNQPIKVKAVAPGKQDNDSVEKNNEF